MERTIVLIFFKGGVASNYIAKSLYIVANNTKKRMLTLPVIVLQITHPKSASKAQMQVVIPLCLMPYVYTAQSISSVGVYTQSRHCN